MPSLARLSGWGVSRGVRRHVEARHDPLARALAQWQALYHGKLHPGDVYEEAHVQLEWICAHGLLGNDADLSWAPEQGRDG